MEKKDKKSNDPRFAAVYNDPKFRNTRRKDLKIKLDSRFSTKDLEFKKKSKVDKYGRRLKDTLENRDTEDFEKYFEKANEEESEEGEDAKVEESPSSSLSHDESQGSDEEHDEVDTSIAERKTTFIDRARGEVPDDYVDSSDEFTSSDSETSSESELDSDVESEEEGAEIDENQPKTGEPSSTLAVVNLDWDHVKSSDLMVTFSSFLPKGGVIERIAIYPSEFGKERMKREDVEGPPRELFQSGKKKKKHHQNHSKNNTTEDNDENEPELDIEDLYEEGDAEKDYDKSALRRYQLERLRYYYAVVYCNNVETASSIYQNCDGTEYESTANMFDLRFVPEGMTFDDEPRDECTSLPKNYKPLTFSTDALQHSNVKLTWDETPAERVEIAKRAFSQKEIEEMDFKAYLASDSDESEEEANEEAKNKLRALVGNQFSGGSISGDTGDGKGKGKGSRDEDGESDIDMEITFAPALEENTTEEVKHAGGEETTIEKVRRKEQERRKARKERIKQLKKAAEEEKREKLRSNKSGEHNAKEDAKAKAELELLMMEDENDTERGLNKDAHFNMNEIVRSEKEKGKKSKYQRKEKIISDNFKPDLNDPRFKEVFEEHDFAIDPSQPEFRETKAMTQILKERNKRTKHREAGKRAIKKMKPAKDGDIEEKKDLAKLVKKLRSKTKA